MDGLESTRQIRAWEKNTDRHLPIIAITAHALQGDRERFLAAGMDDYLTKPLETTALLSALERWTQGPGDSPEFAKPVQDYSSYELALPSMTAGMFGEPVITVSQQPLQEAASTVPMEILPVNFESALRRFSEDHEFMLASLRKFKEQLPARVVEIREAVQNDDTSQLARLAHNLKGVSLNLSVNQLAALALKLEEAGTHEDLTYAPDTVAQLEQEALQVEEYLSRNGV
jgi:CheY-like chemotaxis protein